MCHKVKIIAKNCHGQLSYCATCKSYKLTFNNVLLEFSKKGLKQFKKYVAGIEVEYWEQKFDGIAMKRKIPIQTMQQNLSMIFNKQEIQSLKDLLQLDTKKPYEKISIMDIDYILFLN